MPSCPVFLIIMKKKWCQAVLFILKFLKNHAELSGFFFNNFEKNDAELSWLFKKYTKNDAALFCFL